MIYLAIFPLRLKNITLLKNMPSVFSTDDTGHNAYNKNMQNEIPTDNKENNLAFQLTVKKIT